MGLSRSRGSIVAASAVVSVILILPLALHYGEAVADVGGRNWASIVRRLPRWHSWILMGPGSLLYGWLQRPGGPIEVGKFMSSEVHSNGIGLVTLILAAGGLYLGRARAAVRTLVVVTFLAVLTTTVLPNGFTVWRGLFHLVPGAGALRAVARIGLHLAIPLGVGLAIAFETLTRKRRWAWVLVLALVVAAEQARRVRSFDVERMRSMTAEIEAQVDDGCESFFVSSLGRRRDPFLPENAMWAALSTGVPTVNGRYGNYPSRYPRLLVAAHRREPGGESRAAIAAALDTWLESGSRDPSDTCWIETSVEGGLRVARRLN